MLRKFGPMSVFLTLPTILRLRRTRWNFKSPTESTHFQKLTPQLQNYALPEGALFRYSQSRGVLFLLGENGPLNRAGAAHPTAGEAQSLRGSLAAAQLTRPCSRLLPDLPGVSNGLPHTLGRVLKLLASHHVRKVVASLPDHADNDAADPHLAHLLGRRGPFQHNARRRVQRVHSHGRVNGGADGISAKLLHHRGAGRHPVEQLQEAAYGPHHSGREADVSGDSREDAWACHGLGAALPIWVQENPVRHRW